MSLLRYYHTLRHCKAEQILGRLWYRIKPPLVDTRPAPPLRGLDGSRWTETPSRAPSMMGPRLFRFLNEQHDLTTPADWNDPALSRLWVYNLHYFEDLNAESAPDRQAWHRNLIERWIDENPPPKGTGWEPYTLSLRISNWIKWRAAGNEAPSGFDQSLAVQLRCLRSRLEIHLLGNHLLANAKALVVGGLYFAGDEGEKWLRDGLGLLSAQLEEQILPDGGHFERSAMYHSLILEDLLDVVNLHASAARPVPEFLGPRVAQMESWLEVMTLPDGQIELFNDGAFGIAPPPAALPSYRKRLGLPDPEVSTQPLHLLASTGYARLSRGDAILLVDVGELGPPYLPAHGHADTLSFTLTLGEERFLVDTGTGCYGTSPERLRQRGSSAHNVVTLDGADSSEVWGGFRVARRAHVHDVTTSALSDDPEAPLRVGASHDGYAWRSGLDRVRREWKMEPGRIVIRDVLDGTGVHEVASRFHLHPACTLEIIDASTAVVTGNSGRKLTIAMDSRFDLTIMESSFHPEFGRSEPTQVLLGQASPMCPVTVECVLSWEPACTSSS